MKENELKAGERKPNMLWWREAGSPMGHQINICHRIIEIKTTYLISVQLWTELLPPIHTKMWIWIYKLTAINLMCAQILLTFRKHPEETLTVASTWLMALCSTHWPTGHSRPLAEHNLLNMNHPFISLSVCVVVGKGTVCMQRSHMQRPLHGGLYNQGFSIFWKWHCVSM